MKCFVFSPGLERQGIYEEKDAGEGSTKQEEENLEEVLWM